MKALPIPFIAVKKLGRMLVNEGIFSCVLTFSYQLIIQLMNYFGGILGTDWGFYSLWLAEKTSILLTLFAVLKGIGLLLSKIRLSFLVQGFLSQVVSLVSTSLTTLVATSIISSIICAGASLLIGLGIVLHAVPFKLTRNIGATMIAVVVVFSIGLPLMPHFIDLVTSTVGYTLITNGDSCSANIKLVDALNYEFGQAVIEGYSNGELLYRYSIDTKGSLKVNTYNGFPCYDHEIVLQIADLTYSSIIQRNQETWNITLHIPDVIGIAPNRFILIGSDMNINYFSKSENKVIIGVSNSIQSEFKVYVENRDVVAVLIDDVPVENHEPEALDWHGISYFIYTYTLQPGDHTISVEVNYQSTTPLDVDLYPYALKLFNVDLMSAENLIMIGTYAFIELTVLPLIYLTILFAISLNLAKLLGGVSLSLAKLTVNLY